MPTNQTINDVLPLTQLVVSINGQTVFNTNWTAANATDIVVYARAAADAVDDETQLVDSSNYTVAFIGGSATVEVTFLSGRTIGDIITIMRDTPADRLNLYSNTNFIPAMLNQDTAILTLVDQQAQLVNQRLAPKYNNSVTLTDDQYPEIDLVLPLLEANQIWAKNNDNDEIIPYDVPASGGVAPKLATYLVQIASSEVPNAQAMGSLGAGFVMNTPTTGVQFIRTLAGVANQTAITNPAGVAGNPTVGIAENPTIPGTEYILLPSGTTAQRPITPTDGMVRYNTTNQALEVYEGGSWDSLAGGIVDSVIGTANQIDIDNTDPQNPVASLSSTLVLSGTLEAGGNFNMDSNLINNLLDPVSAQDAATKAYVDSIAAGFTLINPVRVASTANLVATYSNGASGIGATLTVTALGVASIDGVALSLNDRVLFKDQSTTFENGIYYVSDVGSGGTSAVYTRATDFDQPSEIDPGDLVPVLAGSTLAGTLWLQTATVTAVGTDPITFIQFAAAYTNVVTLTGTQTITGDKTFTGTTTLDNFVFDGNQMQHLADLNNYFEFGTDTQNFVTGGSSRMDLSDTGFRLGAANSRVTTILDEDDMVSDSATALATQQSIKAYVDSRPGRLKSFQIFTSGTAQTYTRPAGITSILVEVLGGGGGGAGVDANTANISLGGGGGGGGYARLWVSSAAASYTYTVGGGGAGGAAGTNNGVAGGTTTFSASSLQATGGSGGTSLAPSAAGGNAVTGGGGGVGSNGDINIVGGTGGASFGTLSAYCIGGFGGSSYFGGGATAPVINTNASSAGITALTRGGGGSGACSINNTTDRAGGDGASGLIIVWEFS